MKKTRALLLIIFIAATVCLAACLFGCAKKYTVTYLAAEGGYISGETTQTVSAHKDTTAVYVDPDDGYYFDGWSDGDGHFVRTDKDVTSDITVTATFKRWTFTVQYIAGSYGKIEGESSQIVNMYDNSAEVTAVPYEGYTFVGWSDDVSEATRFEERVEGNVRVYAIFEQKPYVVSFSAGANGSIAGESEQTVVHGNKISAVTATPDWGYVFTGWSDGVQTATRSDIVKADIQATAYFERGFEGGDGSVSNPFTISTYKQLRNIVSYPAEYFKLVNDLDLTGINHQPLFEAQEQTAGGSQPFNVRASKTQTFTGELDGCGYSIKNMTVDCGSQYPSLFGVLDEGFVKNLSVEDAVIKTVDFDTAGGKKYYVGILAGVLNAFAQNVSVSGEIIVNGLHHSGVTVGGLAGQAFYPMINCSSDVDITVNDVVINKTGINSSFCFGGLAGICSAWSVAGCEAKGAITINNSQATNPNSAVISAGGLIGYCYCFGTENTDGDTDEDIEATVRIVNCSSSVNITENKSDVNASGFICVLEAYKFEISDCLSTGDVRSYMAGGFFNSLYAQTQSVIENCRTEGNITARARACGFGFSIRNVKFLGCSVSGDISANGYAGGFFYVAYRAATLRDCIVEGNLTAKYACGFGYVAMAGTVFERCGFTGSIQCSRHGAGICHRMTKTIIRNCYSMGNITVVNTENSNETIGVGGICSWSDGSQIENCYFAGTISVEDEYPSNSYLGIVVGRSSSTAITNCHALVGEDSAVQDVVGKSLGDENEYDIITYANVEDMYNIADALNEGQEEIVWQNVPEGLPEFAV